MTKELPVDILFWVNYNSDGKRVVTSCRDLSEFAEPGCLDNLLAAVADAPDELHLTLRKDGNVYSGNYGLKRPVVTVVKLDHQNPCKFILYSLDPSIKSP